MKFQDIKYACPYSYIYPNHQYQIQRDIYPSIGVEEKKKIKEQTPEEVGEAALQLVLSNSKLVVQNLHFQAGDPYKHNKTSGTIKLVHL